MDYFSQDIIDYHSTPTLNGHSEYVVSTTNDNYIFVYHNKIDK